VTLYPHLLNRIAIAFSTLVLACMAWLSPGPLWLIVPMLVAEAILSVRCYRMSVTCTPGVLVVRGILVTRTISRSAITSIPEDARAVPHVNWRDESGKDRWSPMFVFATQESELSFTRRAKIAQLAKIQAWFRAEPAAVQTGSVPS
jgi:hypothetical protein